MKRIVLSFLSITALGLMLALPVAAQAQMKVAVVSLQKALNTVEEGKRAMGAIQSEIGAKKKQLETMKTELKTMRDDLEKKKGVLSKEAMGQKANEIQTKFMTLQQKAVEFDNELKKKENESVQRILTRLRNTVIAISKERGYDMVFENSTDTVIYSKNAVDITADVVSAYNSGKQ